MAIDEEKKYIRKRVSEIIQDYLYDPDESYAYISLYFEKNNGESQHKRLVFGHPSRETPDDYRDEPHGYSEWLNGLDLFARSLDEVLVPKTIWIQNDGTEWDGTQLKEIRRGRKS